MRDGGGAPDDAQGSRKTILVVAMGASVHTARWLNAVRAPDLRFVLLSVYEAPVSEMLQSWRLVKNEEDLAEIGPQEVGVFDTSTIADADARALNAAIGYQTWRPSFMPQSIRFAQPLHLAEAVRRFRPALVHSMEVQMAGYLCLAAKDYLGTAFPPWLLSNWGSDIFLYRKLEEHRPRLAAIARHIDAYLAECHRDNALIRQMGFRGMLLPPTPASGGMDFTTLPPLALLPNTSQRTEILVKGYHGWSGRGLHILGALHLAAPSLSGMTIRITLAQAEMQAMAAELAAATGLAVICDNYLPSHTEALNRIGRSRITVGLGISDAISTTLLEAMTMGSFPIQANTSCGCEWVRDGKTGFLVSPHDIAGLARAIVRAATDDALVDAAAPRNREIVEERWDARANGARIMEQYRRLVGRSGAPSLEALA